MKYILIFFFFVVSSFTIFSQTAYCPGDPIVNPWLADSPWPTFHRNNFAQASTCIPGPQQSDAILLKKITSIKGGTSPWVYLSDKYPDGSRVLVMSNATHFVKLIDTEEGILIVDSLRIDFDFIQSFGYAFIQAKGNKWFVPDPKFNPDANQYSRIVKIEDEDPSDPYSRLIKTGEFSFEGSAVNKVGHLMLNYDGQLIFTGQTDEDKNVAHVGLLDQDLNVLDVFEFPTFPGEIVSHNSSPVEPNNSWYLVTTHRLIRFDWDGQKVSIGWEAAYDFVADGPTGSFAEGSGTTPTLMGYGSDEDKLVLVADGHSRNNLIAFWREIPEEWSGISGQDIRFADSIMIPLAKASNNTFQSIENSPTVHQYSVAIAQFNGFLGYDCENEKGVQKFTWDTEANKWKLDWKNDEINMNGVLTYSEGSNLVYSSGKEEDCNYYMYGLNWDNGDVEFKLQMGAEGSLFDDPFYDTGNNTIIDEEGNLYMPGSASLVKLEKSKPSSIAEYEDNDKIKLSPNPAKRFFRITSEYDERILRFQIIDTSGSIIKDQKYRTPYVPLKDLPNGLYFVKFFMKDSSITKRLIKRSH